MNYYGNCNNRNCCPSGETGKYVTIQGPAGPMGPEGPREANRDSEASGGLRGREE